MRTLRATAAAAAIGWAALGANLGAPSTAAGQSPLAQPGFVAGGPAAVGGVGHALFHAGAPDPRGFVNAHGEQVVVPAQYCDPSGGYGACYGDGGYGGGVPGGAAGDPFGGAFMNTEQCGPHYFDFSAEYLNYRRDDAGFGESVVYSTNGFVNDDNAIITSPFDDQRVALRGGDVDSDANGNGFRLTGRIDVGALSVAEFVYSGVWWDDQTAVALQDGQTRLFSVYSLWGSATNGNFNADGTAGAPAGNNFAETDNADRHELSYESELHTAEASFRRYWVGFNPRVSGTVMIGFRYTNLSDTLGFRSFNTVGNVPRSISVESEADNDLAGVQVGGDGWVTVLQGLRIGGETKVGLYNNDFQVRSTTSATEDAPAGQATLLSGDDAAFIAEGKLMLVADLTPHWSLKAGYEVLFISDIATVGDSVALAQPYGNINNISTFLPTAPPAGVGPVAGLSNSGDAFFHGWTVGAEYVW